MALSFGEAKVVNGEGKEVDTSTLYGEGKVIGLYFSAHWCPPCRAFTPQLATWYKKFKESPNGDKLEIVFVSSDRDNKQFDEYFKEMPWLALSYSDRDKKAQLSKKYKVQGIPTLVFLDGKGSLITAEGRSIVMEDPDGSQYPWTPKKFGDIIPGKLVSKAGEETNWSDVTEEYIGLYFSAHWCGPCRAFTPQLVKTYNKIREAGKSFQIVFVSSDRDEDSMKEYLAEMPWLCVPFGDTRKKSLSRLFDVSGIPTLVILKRDGEIVTSQGRGAVSEDQDGKDFPWTPKPVNSLKASTASNINEEASLIWFLDDKTPSSDALEVLTPLATQYAAEVKSGNTEETLLFFYHSEEEDEEEIGGSLKQFCSLPTDARLVLLDIPNQKVFSSKEVTPDIIKKTISDFKSAKLEMKPLRS